MLQTLKTLLMLSTFFFTNIGTRLSKTIPQSKKNFKNFLNNSSLNSFVLKPVTHDKVWKLIFQLNNRKALGPTSIPATILKDNIDILVRPLTFNLNQSFEQDFFPKILKIVQVLLIHKKKILSQLATTTLYLYYLYLAKFLKKLRIEFILFSVNINWSIQINLVSVQIT